MISNGWDLTKINIADTEGTERRFSLARSGDGDRAKCLQPFGQHLMPPGEDEPPGEPQMLRPCFAWASSPAHAKIKKASVFSVSLWFIIS